MYASYTCVIAQYPKELHKDKISTPRSSSLQSRLSITRHSSCMNYGVWYLNGEILSNWDLLGLDYYLTIKASSVTFFVSGNALIKSLDHIISPIQTTWK